MVRPADLAAADEITGTLISFIVMVPSPQGPMNGKWLKGWNYWKQYHSELIRGRGDNTIHDLNG
jgi:hypothetical protein